MSSRPRRQPVIVGIAEAPLRDGKVTAETTPLRLQAKVARDAVADAGLELSEVDGLLTAGLWGSSVAGVFPTTGLTEYLGLQPRFSDSHNVGGSSFEAHLAHAAMAIERGYCDVALITYGSLQRTQRTRSLAGRQPELNMQYQAPFGLLTPVGGYALAAQRHMHQYGTTPEQLAEVAVAARRWAGLNPAATKREPIDVDDVMSSPMVSDPLHRLDCCLVTDGAGAIVVTSEAYARDRCPSPVEIWGYGESETHMSIVQMPDLTMPPVAESGRAALEMAGVKVEDIDVFQLYDSFTITVILQLEALGICPVGEGGSFVSDGRISPGGSTPLNTSGGGLAHSHPGMYGIFLIIEAVRQLRGTAGARQVPGARTALVSGMGGTLSSAATCVLGRN